ncbi:MAG: HdeA/HdeB family chaperone [Rhodoplanes sp.]|jgi:acid stress chaperone HdeB|nr:HdeA/HdeB family chaperone [Rhodoplanes sp.]
MKKTLGAIVLVAALTGAPPAFAQVIDLSTITCKDFFEGNKDRIDFVVAWLLGYYTGEDDPPVLDFAKLKDKAAKLGAYCATNPTHGLVTAADKVME